MQIRLYEVKLTFENESFERVERKFVAIGVSREDAVKRVTDYYLSHSIWMGTITKAEAFEHKFSDFAVVSGEVY